VIRIFCTVEVLKVTADAVGGRSLIVAANMACGALQGGMGAGQGEARELQVIEGSSQPRFHVAMTLLAVGGKAQGSMIRRLGTEIGVDVTAGAVSRQPHILSCRGSLMAGLALGGGVGTQERKAV